MNGTISILVLTALLQGSGNTTGPQPWENVRVGEVSLKQVDLVSAVRVLSRNSSIQIHTVLDETVSQSKFDFRLSDDATLGDGLRELRRRFTGLTVGSSPRGIVIVTTRELGSLEWIRSRSAAGVSFEGTLGTLVQTITTPSGWWYMPPSGSAEQRHVRFRCDRPLTGAEFLAQAAEEAGMQIHVTVDQTAGNVPLIAFEDTAIPFSRVQSVSTTKRLGTIWWTIDWIPKSSN